MSNYPQSNFGVLSCPLFEKSDKATYDTKLGRELGRKIEGILDYKMH